MYCFIIICWLVLGNAEAILKLCLVMECIVLLLFVVLNGLMQQLYWGICLNHEMYCFIIICWLVLGNAAAILGTLSCHGMYCFIIICWLVLGNAAAILVTLSCHGMYCFIIICWLVLA